MHYSEKSAEDQSNFFYVFAILIQAGVPIPSSVKTASDVISNRRLKDIMSEIEAALRRGSKIASSFAKYPKMFPTLIVGMIRAGEESGNLGIILLKISEMIETKYKFLEKPTQLFEKMVFFIKFNTSIQVGMPIEYIWDIASDGIQDKILKNAVKQIKKDVKNGSKVSSAFSKFPKIFSITIIEIIRIGEKSYSLDWTTERICELTEMKHKFLEKQIPLSDEIVFFINLGMLTKIGMPIVRSMEIATVEIKNSTLRNTVEKIKENIKSGVGITDAFSIHDIFPKFVVPLIKSGVIGGVLDVMLERIVAIYQGRFS